MKKIITLILTAALLIACLFSFTACKPKTLVMGTNAAFEPFEFRSGDNEIVGIDVDFVYAIAEEMGVEIKIEDMAFESLLTALSNDTVDFVAA
ncbi:MAG TPA: transporter substrate-binding domain-containing protein, partial [Clostridia bacterium]|nr:transporter substrate-binding domain-containing protein [Clostridia bacterium]